MPDRELRRMRRAELVEIILALKQTEDRLRAENAALSAQLQERQIHIENAGSIAQAALELNKVFEAAQTKAPMPPPMPCGHRLRPRRSRSLRRPRPKPRT